MNVTRAQLGALRRIRAAHDARTRWGAWKRVHPSVRRTLRRDGLVRLLRDSAVDERGEPHDRWCVEVTSLGRAVVAGANATRARS